MRVSDFQKRGTPRGDLPGVLPVPPAKREFTKLVPRCFICSRKFSLFSSMFTSTFCTECPVTAGTTEGRVTPREKKKKIDEK